MRSVAVLFRLFTRRRRNNLLGGAAAVFAKLLGHGSVQVRINDRILPIQTDARRVPLIRAAA